MASPQQDSEEPESTKTRQVIKATVQHSYHAEKDGELDLEEGDVIQVFESRKDGWLRGVKQERSGWFPGSHIKGCTKEIVKFSRRAERDSELDLEEGDVILIFDKQKSGWWRGMIGEREGLFPVNYLQGYSPKIVQYSYRAEKDDEIDLVIGGVVLILEKSEDGRCKGSDGVREGWFPGNCTAEVFETTKALVETPHHGDDGELDLVKDEIMDVLLKRDSQWWIGELKGKRGLFPANNVKEIKVIEATVQHSYHAEKDDELDLEERDVVQVFESRKDGWLRGVKQERSGWFPGSHIKGCTKEVVKYPFRAERNYHLDLEEGDLVLVLDKEEYGWWRGMIGERQGWFPAEMLQGYSAEIVQYSHRAEKDDEIDLAIGEVVQVSEKSEDGRCKGMIGGREGWFPGNCTRELPNCSQALVETPHHGDDDSGLDLEKGDVVTVLLKRDSHWWIGRLREKKGLFPANNVKEIKGVEATVQHSYRAEKDGELDLEEGDVVQVFESRKDGWLRGVKQERSGWFPGSHIKGCTKEVVKLSRRAEREYQLDLEEGDVVLVFDKQRDGWWRGMIGERKGLFPADMLQGYSAEIVQYSHRAKKDDEIDLVIGEVVLVVEKSEDGRCKGVIGEREGWFPGNCTRELSEITQALVETPHHGDNDGELDLEKGDVVTVLLKRDSHWWIGRLRGKRGLFPANNVKEIKEFKKALEFQKNLEDVLKTSASVTLKITKCTTIGPPEVGKTHLKCLLLGQEWDPNTGRTDVIRAPEWVEHYIEDSSTWKLFTCDERMQAICRNIMNKKYQEEKEEVPRQVDVVRVDSNIAQETEDDQKPKPQEDDQNGKMHKSHPKTGAALQQPEEPDEEKNAPEVKPVRKDFFKGLKTLDASLDDVMKGNCLSDPELEGHILGEKRLMYFVDTGGQEYYHDIHPILITSPSVYFVVFNLMKCLEEGGEANFFREELIQRPLRSIHAFGTKRVRQSKFLKIHSSDPKIFIIGTHLDQVREVGREEEIESVSSDVQSELSTKPYKKFLQPDPNDLAFWPINNTLAGNPPDEDSEDSEYICDLKSEAVEGVHDAEVTVPLSWLILEQTIKTIPQADFFPYRQLFNLCSKRELIRNEEEFQTMLYIFHILGLFFFPPILKDAPLRDDEVVYTNPDFLYRMTSKLLKECRFRESPIAKETCPQQGVIQDYRKLLLEIGMEENIEECFLNMLQDLKIIVKIESEDLILFPAALPKANLQVSSSEAPSSPGPLLLSFTSSRLLRVCYIPTGFFRLLIADLAANPTWTLELDKLSHNSVTFDVGTGVLGLLERVSFIEVTFTPSDNSLPSSSSHNAMYQHLKKRVLSLWSNVYGQKDESSEQWIHWGFPCRSESHPEEHHTHIAKFSGDPGEYVASCLHPAGKFIQRVSKEQLVWFMN